MSPQKLGTSKGKTRWLLCCDECTAELMVETLNTTWSWNNEQQRSRAGWYGRFSPKGETYFCPAHAPQTLASA